MLGAGVDQSLQSTGQADNWIAVRKGATVDFQSLLGRDPERALAADAAIASDESGPLVSAELVVQVVLPRADGGRASVTVRGVGPRALAVHRQARVAEGRMLSPGAGEVLIGRVLAGRYHGAQPGGTVRLGRRDFLVVGVLDAGGAAFESEVWGDAEELLDAFHRSSFSTLVMRVRPGEAERLVARAEADPRLGVDVRNELGYYAAQSRNLGTYVRILGLFLAVVFSFGATLGAMMTMYGQVAARRREIGTLRALGFSRRAVAAGFLAEALGLALVGGALGLGLAALMQRAHFPIMNLQTISVMVLSFRLTPAIVAAAALFSLLIGLLGGFLPALRAARLDLVQSIRE
jgi:ABC-type lipoprotein release transport system permease subunit